MIQTNLSQQLLVKGLTIATAESCTGGLIAKLLTDTPGISAVYKGSIVAYSLQIKQKLLGVSEEMLHKYTAASKPVALAMARNCLDLLVADCAIATTGYADGANHGQVWIATAVGQQEEAQLFNFAGDRSEVRLAASLKALEIITKRIFF